MILRKLAATLIAAGACSLAAYAQTTAASATRTFTFPLVGLGSTETASISLINTASNSTSGATTTAASCTGSVSFVGATNVALGTATSFTIASNQSATITLPFTKANITGIRGEIRGIVSYAHTSGVPCSLQFNFETYDSVAGATHVHLEGSAPEANGFGGSGGFGR